MYWEMYGVSPAGETLAYRLTVTRERTPWYRRAAEKLGVVERQAPVRMQWDEPSARPGAAHSRALAVDFSTLPEGRYRIDLTPRGRRPNDCDGESDGGREVNGGNGRRRTGKREPGRETLYPSARARGRPG